MRNYWKLVNPDSSSHGSELLKVDYLVGLADASKRDSLSGIALRVGRQFNVSRVFNEEEFLQLIVDVAEALAGQANMLQRLNY